eukprot:243145_1
MIAPGPAEMIVVDTNPQPQMPSLDPPRSSTDSEMSVQNPPKLQLSRTTPQIAPFASTPTDQSTHSPMGDQTTVEVGPATVASVANHAEACGGHQASDMASGLATLDSGMDCSPMHDQEASPPEANGDGSMADDEGPMIGPPSPPLGMRVKIWILSEDTGQWIDASKAVGRLTYSRENGRLVLRIVDEVTGEVMKQHHACDTVEYERQGMSIITWAEGADPDVAVSFQEADACEMVWGLLRTPVQRAQPSTGVADMVDEAPPAGRGGGDGGGRASRDSGFESDMLDSSFSSPYCLAAPELANLKEILSALEVGPRDPVIHQLNSNSYVDSLFKLFTYAEDLENGPTLTVIFQIFKKILLLNDTELLCKLLDPETIMLTIGVFEYDPDRPSSSMDDGVICRKHRHFLENVQSKHTVLDFPDPDVLNMIAYVYRLTYIRDAILFRFLDEPTAMNLNVLVSRNEQQVVQQLLDCPEFLARLFARLRNDSEKSKIDKSCDIGTLMGGKKDSTSSLEKSASAVSCASTLTIHSDSNDSGSQSVRSPSPSPPRTGTPLLLEVGPAEGDGSTDSGTQSASDRADSERCDLFRFFGELMRLVKRLALDEKMRAFEKLTARDAVFFMLEAAAVKASATSDRQIWPIIADSLDVFLTCRPNCVREFSLKARSPGLKLVDRLLQVMLCRKLEVDVGITFQMSIVIQKFLTCEELGPLSSQNLFASRFFSSQIQKIVASLADIAKAQASLSTTGTVACSLRRLEIDTEIQYQCCEILTLCVRKFHHLVNGDFIKSGAVRHVVQLVRATSRRLQLCAIRFVRACISLKDDLMNKYITKSDSLRPVFDLFLANGTRYNLLNSTVIELVEFVRRENIRALVDYVCTQHLHRFKGVNYVTTFRDLQTRFDQNAEAKDASSSVASSDDVSGGPGIPGTGPLPAPPDQKVSVDRAEEQYFSEDSTGWDEKEPKAAEMRPDSNANISVFMERSPVASKEEEFDFREIVKNRQNGPPSQAKTAAANSIFASKFGVKLGVKRKAGGAIKFAISSVPSPKSSPSCQKAMSASQSRSNASPPVKLQFGNSDGGGHLPVTDDERTTCSPPLRKSPTERKSTAQSEGGIRSPKPAKPPSKTDYSDFLNGMGMEFTQGGILHSPLETLQDGPLMGVGTLTNSQQKKRKLDNNCAMDAPMQKSPILSE